MRSDDGPEGPEGARRKQCHLAPDNHTPPDPRRRPFDPGSGTNPPPQTPANPPRPHTGL